MATGQEVKNFIESIAPLVINICNKKSRKILPSVCIAQACIESAYGTTERMVRANALFGIKVGSGVKYGTAWNGMWYDTKTKEIYNGIKVGITDRFRAYSTVEASIEYYYDLIGTCSRYSKAVGQINYSDAIKAIVDGKYTTDPINYVVSVIKIIERNNLTQYDTIMKSGKISTIPAVDVTVNTKYSIGEKVKITKYWSSSTSSDKAINTTREGIVVRINPYLIANINNNKSYYGWTNERYMIATENGEISHKVVSGDSLSSISKKYNTDVNKILAANIKNYPTIKANFIRVGWVLTIPQ